MILQITEDQNVSRWSLVVGGIEWLGTQFEADRVKANKDLRYVRHAPEVPLLVAETNNARHFEMHLLFLQSGNQLRGCFSPQQSHREKATVAFCRNFNRVCLAQGQSRLDVAKPRQESVLDLSK